MNDEKQMEDTNRQLSMSTSNIEGHVETLAQQLEEMESVMVSNQRSGVGSSRQEVQSLEDGLKQLETNIKGLLHRMSDGEFAPETLSSDRPGLGSGEHAQIASRLQEVRKTLTEIQSRSERLRLSVKVHCPPNQLDTLMLSRRASLSTTPSSRRATNPGEMDASLSSLDSSKGSQVVTRLRSLEDHMREAELRQPVYKQLSEPLPTAEAEAGSSVRNPTPGLPPHHKMAKIEQQDKAKDIDTEMKDAFKRGMEVKDVQGTKSDMQLEGEECLEGKAESNDGEVVIETELPMSDSNGLKAYSWGRGDLGALLHADLENHGAEEVTFRRTMPNLTGVASSLYHTMTASTTGELYGCGTNFEGQVCPKRSEETITEPLIIESLIVQRITQVSCGLYHTACVTSTGTLMTFGGNEAGQLGHNTPGGAQGSISHNTPRTVYGLQGSIVIQAACGDLFTLVVTTVGECYSFGVGAANGHPDGENRYRAEKIPALSCLPIAMVAAGGSHSVAISVTGHAFSWGSNHRGQVGVEKDVGGTVQTPVRMGVPQLASAACGARHSVLLTTEGDLYGCGQNTNSQLGAQAGSTNVCPATKLTAGEGRAFRLAACGEAHTLLLDTEGVLWGMGKNDNNQVISGETTDQGNLVKISLLGQTTEAVYFVAAGGDQSFCLAASNSAPIQSAVSAPAIAGLGLSSASSGAPIARMFSIVQTARPMDTAELSAIIQDGQLSGSTRRLSDAMRDIFSSPYLMNGSFLTDQTSSQLDVVGIESIYKSYLVMGKKEEIVTTLRRALARAVSLIEQEAPNFNHGDAVRCLVIIWQCPLMASPNLTKDIFLQLCSSLLKLSFDARNLVLHLIEKDVPGHLFATRFVKPLQEHLSHHLGVEFGKGTAVPMFIIIIKWLYTVNEIGGLVRPSTFNNETISKLPDNYLLNDLVRWKSLRNSRQQNTMQRFHFCDYPFLLDTDSKRRLLKMEAHIHQQQAAQQSVRANFILGMGLNPFLVLQVQRTNLLQTTLNQMASFGDMDLKKQLKVVFMGEDGVDEGGVRKEFFQLLVADLFNLNFGMFQTCGKGRHYWFNKDCVWSNNEYHLIGTLLGLAIYNGVVLDIHFPIAVYKKLLKEDLTLPDLADIDEELTNGLQQLLDYPGDDVEDVFCRTFEVTWDDFGAQRSFELKEGGQNIPVTSENKEEYVKLYVQWTLSDSIAQQFEHFFNGFMRVMSGASITLLRAEELELLVAGQPHLDFKELEKVTQYEGGFSADHPVIQMFWSMVHDMELENQRKLLMFVTGSMKAPIGGLGNLNFKIQRMGPDSEKLPTSHTCFNTLLLPEYSSQAKLKNRLLIAIQECEGFGLQ